MFNVIKNYIFHIFIEVLSAILTYFSSSEWIWTKIDEKNIFNYKIDIELSQNFCLVLSIVVSSVFLTFILIRKNINFEKVKKQRDLLLNMHKENLGLGLQEYFPGFSSFDMRIFSPKYPRLYSLFDKLLLCVKTS